MQGDIWVESELGSGSCFTLQIPLVAGKHDDPLANLDFAGQRIWLVDTSPFLAETMTSYLAAQKAKVRSFHSADDALACLRQGIADSAPGILIAGTGLAAAEIQHLTSEAEKVVSKPHGALIRLDDTSLYSRNRPRRDASGTVWLDAVPLHRQALLQAVAALLGLVDAQVFRVDGAARAAKRRAARTEKLLVADDNETNRDVIRRQLKVLGYQNVVVVSDGRDALDELAAAKYDLLLTDCHMPNVDGFDLARQIRKREAKAANRPKKGMPIIAITAAVTPADQAACLDAGMNATLLKPIEMSELETCLVQWLGPASGQGEQDAAATEADPNSPVVTVARGRGILPDGPLDPGVLIESFGEDRDTIIEIIQTFPSSAEKIRRELADAARAADINAVGAAAHKLKSAARTIGANALADICLELETAGKTGNMPAAENLLQGFQDSFQETMDFIARLQV